MTELETRNGGDAGRRGRVRARVCHTIFVGLGREQEAVGPEQMSQWRKMVGTEDVSLLGSPSSRRGVGVKIWGSGVVGTETDLVDLSAESGSRQAHRAGVRACLAGMTCACFAIECLRLTETLDVNCGIRGGGGERAGVVMIRATRRARLAHARPVVDPEDSRCSRTR